MAIDLEDMDKELGGWAGKEEQIREAGKGEERRGRFFVGEPYG